MENTSKKRYSKKTTYRISYTSSGITTTQNYKYIGRDRFSQIIMRRIGDYDGHSDIAFNEENMEIIDLKI